MSSLPKLIIVALSGRALALSARRPALNAAQRDVLVLDACGYRDTQAAAPWIDVSTQDDAALDFERVAAALAGDEVGRNPQIVLGAGFEHAPAQIDRLREAGRLYANSGDIVRAWKDPLLSTELLRAVGWDVPSTQYGPPESPQGWLQKAVGGSGGDHIRMAGDTDAGGYVSGRYYQRRLEGRSLSAVFIGDGERAYMLGISHLRRQIVGAAAYRYAGAMTGAMLPAPLVQSIQARLDRLVRVSGLRGLCGFDFLLDQETLVALEINPQPPAGFELYELYDGDIPEGLVHWHIRSFLGPISAFAERLAARAPAPVHATAVLYAEAPMIVPPDAAFPAWCRDLPGSGRYIDAQTPVLAVVATESSHEAARVTIEARLRALRQMIAPWRVSAPVAAEAPVAPVATVAAVAAVAADAPAIAIATAEDAAVHQPAADPASHG